MIVHKGNRLKGVKFAACKGPLIPMDASQGSTTNTWRKVTCGACARHAGFKDLADLHRTRRIVTVLVDPNGWERSICINAEYAMKLYEAGRISWLEAKEAIDVAFEYDEVYAAILYTRLEKGTK